jgi:hypothetical protein
MDDDHLSNITSQNCGRNKKARRKEKKRNPNFARTTIGTRQSI